MLRSSKICVFSIFLFGACSSNNQSIIPIDASTSDASPDTALETTANDAAATTDSATTRDASAARDGSETGVIMDGAACASPQRACGDQCTTCPTDAHATEFDCNGSACIIRSCATGYTVTAQACTRNVSFPFSGAATLVRPPTGQLHITSMALSGDGNLLIVGDARGGASSGPGTVTTYTRNRGAWSFTGNIPRPSSSGGVSSFGDAVALTSDANTLFVRGYHGFDNGYVVTIFARSGGGWTSIGALSRPDRDPGFGSRLALSADGSTLLQGTGSSSGGAETFHGRAHVYTRSAGTWGQPTELTPATQPVYFGWSLALSGDGSVLAVGDVNSGSGAGVMIYARGGTAWSGTSVAPPSGTGVALSRDGNQLVVSDWTGGADHGGLVTAFSRENGAWVPGNSPMRPSGATVFGRRLALSGDGNVLVVSRRGHATVFVRTNGVWNSGDDLVMPSAIAEPVYLVLSSDDSTLALSDHNGDVVAIYQR